jgi:hypothetical protein
LLEAEHGLLTGRVYVLVIVQIFSAFRTMLALGFVITALSFAVPQDFIGNSTRVHNATGDSTAVQDPNTLCYAMQGEANCEAQSQYCTWCYQIAQPNLAGCYEWQTARTMMNLHPKEFHCDAPPTV